MRKFLIYWFSDKLCDLYMIISGNQLKNVMQRDRDSSVYTYDFMMNLKEKDYPKYLCKAYLIKTGRKLNLHNPISLSEKVQWLKIYDNLPIKSQLTDKVLVREWVKNKIGEEYLKPVLWIGDRFDDIPFDTFPNSFIIKCNHGCKWNIIIKDKNNFLSNKILTKKIKKKIDGWMSQSFFGWSDFELQYKGIKPRIIVEKLMRENINDNSEELWIWCANSEPYTTGDNNELSQKALELSHILAEGFKFVRVDWIVYNKKLYFGEMTFTPLSGFFKDNVYMNDFYEKLSKKISIKR